MKKLEAVLRIPLAGVKGFNNSADPDAVRQTLATEFGCAPHGGTYPNVMTGQQPGLLGGPTLCVCKLAGAVGLAREKNSAAYYWVGGDDDDLSEAGTAGIVIADRRIDVRCRFSPAMRHRPLATIPAATALECLEKNVAAHPLAAKFLAPYRNPENTLDRASFECLTALAGPLRFCGVGSVDPDWRHRVKDLVERIIFDTSAVGKLLAAGKIVAKMAGTPVPLSADVRETGFYLAHESSRHKLIRVSDGFEAVGLCKIAANELRAVIADTPERILPNAWTRLLVATAAYEIGTHVLGPGEMLYALQTLPLFAHFDLPTPEYVLRPSVTIVPFATEELPVPLAEFIGDTENAFRRASELAVPEKLVRAERALYQTLDTAKGEFAALIRAEYPDLSENLEREFEKSTYAVGRAAAAVVKGAARRTAVGKMLQKLRAYLPPNALQERELSPWSFASAHDFTGNKILSVLEKSAWRGHHIVMAPKP